MVSDHHGLLAVGQIDPDDRVLRRQQLPHPRQPQVAVAISPGQAGTVTHGRPPRCVGYQARQPHQEDVSTSSTDALRGVTSERYLSAARPSAPHEEDSGATFLDFILSIPTPWF